MARIIILGLRNGFSRVKIGFLGLRNGFAALKGPSYAKEITFHG
ncbi:hypothetical protein HMPREF1075_00010 [Parabacteroides distasonis CL03T12C09]|jgi:hypothetical protein|nr:hypothetical protein HMPREF1075_00010 [Parabacteroides distasonis CL03T12C09]